MKINNREFKLGCSINKNIGELIENEEMMKYQKFGMTKEELKNNDLSKYLPKKLESKKDDIEEYIFYTTEWLKIKLVFKNKMNEEIQKNEQYISTIILLRHDEEKKKVFNSIRMLFKPLMCKQDYYISSFCFNISFNILFNKYIYATILIEYMLFSTEKVSNMSPP
eukprot:gene8486-310_t